jgi:hypothetical protein
MKDKEINKILKEYKLTYAPWEYDGGDCPEFMEGSLVEFGKRMYELGQKSKRSTSLEDRDGNEAIEGDLRIYNGKEYILEDMGFQWCLNRSMCSHVENDTVVVTEDVIWDSELVNKTKQP